MITGLVLAVEPGGVTLEVSAESCAARQGLGPVAWSVLETLALVGREVDGRWVAVTNVRDLAGRLGIGKDRAAAALLALRQAGLVVARTSRDVGTARFAASSYEVLLPVSRNTDTPHTDAPRVDVTPPRAATVRTRARRVASGDDTLELFSSLS